MTKVREDNVLVTCGGGFQGLAILEGLRRIAGVRTIVCDWSPNNVGRFFACAFRRSPPLARPDEYIAFLCDLVSKENIGLIIPASDLDLELLAVNRTLFEGLNVTVAVSDRALNAILMDKRATNQLAVEAGVSVLDEVLVKPDEIVTSDLIAKPRRGFGGKGHHVLRCGQVPAACVPGLDQDKYLVQRYLEGAREYSVDFCINTRGEVSPLAARERIRSFSGFSILGQSAGHRTDLLHATELFSQHIARRGALGGFNVQFIEDGACLRLIDVNARFGTSSSFSLLMGTNLQAWLLSDRATPARHNVKLIKYVAQTSAPADALAVDGVVFDLDDTLIDQKVWISSKLKLLHSKYSEELPARLTFLKTAYQILEEGNRSLLIDSLVERLSLPAKLRDELIEAYRAIIPEDIVIYPDVGRVLSELSRRGFRIGLLTDNPARSQRQKLERLLPQCAGSAAFDAVVLTDELGVGKPNIRGYQAVAKAMGVPCARLVMVGDNLFRDAFGALEAGFAGAFLLGRQGGFFNFNRGLAEELDEVDRIRWINNLDELLWHLPETTSDPLPQRVPDLR